MLDRGCLPLMFLRSGTDVGFADWLVTAEIPGDGRTDTECTQELEIPDTSGEEWSTD